MEAGSDHRRNTGNCLSMQAVVWKDKAHLEFNLGREVRNKKKGFCRSISSKRNTKMWKLLNVEKGDLATRDTETAEALNTSCSLVFTEDLPLATPDPEVSGKAWSKQALPLSEENQVRKRWNKLDIHRIPGTQQHATVSTDRVYWCHWKVNLNYLWKVMAFGGGSLGLKKKQMSLWSSRRARKSGELHSGQPHHNPWEHEGANNLGKHFPAF